MTENLCATKLLNIHAETSEDFCVNTAKDIHIYTLTDILVKQSLLSGLQNFTLAVQEACAFRHNGAPIESPPYKCSGTALQRSSPTSPLGAHGAEKR